MQPPYVSSNVGRMLCPVLAIWAIKSGQLAALELEVIIQIVFASEFVAALGTGERLMTLNEIFRC